jgi:hypothetical protein
MQSPAATRAAQRILANIEKEKNLAVVDGDHKAFANLLKFEWSLRASLQAVSLVILLACSFVAQGQNVLIMAAPTDTLTKTFTHSRECRGLVPVQLFEHKPATEALAVAGNNGTYQVLLVLYADQSKSADLFFGSDYRKGTEAACRYIRAFHGGAR